MNAYGVFFWGVCQMEFRAIDASYATSPPIVVDVSIRAAETDAPRVSWNTGTLATKTKKKNKSPNQPRP